MTVVVDNASVDETLSFLASQADVHTVHLPQNGGGAGGFEAGLKAAMDMGACWVWLLDDDCLPDIRCIECLLDAVVASDDACVAAVGPGVGPTVESAIYGYRRNPAHTVGHAEVAGSNIVAYDVDWTSFVGLLIRADACRTAGDIRGDFFLWNDDTEYCLRLRCIGWRLGAVANAFVHHESVGVVTRKTFGRTRSVKDNPPWKDFLGVRNLFYLNWLTGLTPYRDGRSLVRLAAHELVSAAKVFLVDRRNGRDRAHARLLGLGSAVAIIFREWRAHPGFKDPRRLVGTGKPVPSQVRFSERMMDSPRP